MTEPEDSLPGDFDPRQFATSFYRTALAVFLSPGIFFRKMYREGGLANPFLFLLCSVIIHSLLAGLFRMEANFILKNLLLGTLFPFVTAGVLFLIITRLFRGAGNYEMAFRVNAYASAVNLVSWLPVVGLVLEIYRIYLLVIGLSCVFSIRASRAFLAIILTIIVFVIAAGVLSPLT